MSVLRNTVEYHVPSCLLHFTGPQTSAGVSTLPLKVKASQMLADQLCPTHCDPVDCSPPGSSVHVSLQARILEWVAIPFSRGFSWPKFREAQNQGSPRFCLWGSWDTDDHPILSFSSSRTGMRLGTCVLSSQIRRCCWSEAPSSGLCSAGLVLAASTVIWRRRAPAVSTAMHLSSASPLSLLTWWSLAF